MITTEKVVAILKNSKVELSSFTIDQKHISELYEGLINDTDYITQMLVQATNSTQSETEAIEFIINEYIYAQLVGQVMQKLNNYFKIEIIN